MLNIPWVINTEKVESDKNSSKELEVKDGRDSSQSRPKITPVSWREMLPPPEFVEWLAKNHPEALTSAQWETVEHLYTSKSFREVSRKSRRHKNVAKKAWERLVSAFDEYREEWEFSKQGISSDSFEQRRENVGIPAPQKFWATQKKPQKGTTSKTELRYSFRTTTFREVDKAVSEILSSEVRDMLVERRIYSQLGKMAFLLLTQRGYIDVKKLSRSASDPDAFTRVVLEGFERLVDASDPHRIMQLEEENRRLHYTVIELNLENNRLNNLLRKYEESSKLVISILTDEQQVKLLKLLALQELSRKYKDQSRPSISL